LEKIYATNAESQTISAETKCCPEADARYKNIFDVVQKIPTAAAVTGA
jgi:hypothetical protein